MNQPEDFAIGITSFNRPNLLYKTIASIKVLDEHHPIIIFDDASTEIDYAYVFKEIPRVSIFRRDQPTGRADFAMAQLMDLFLNTETKYLVIVDSDLIVDPEITKFICESAQTTQGIFTLFNTKSHPEYKKSGDWLFKKHIGAAGTVFHRDVLRRIRENVPASPQYDWDWSKYLVNSGIDIMCTERSYFQHVGITFGQNSSLLSGDYGINFQGYNKSNVSNFLDEYIEKQDQMNRYLINELARLRESLIASNI